MSHFVVGVITHTGTEKEVVNLLAPFHEFECTGEDDQYVLDMDITEEGLKAYAERPDRYQDMSPADYVCDWYGLAKLTEGQELDLVQEHKFGYVVANEAGELVKAIDRTNPNRKWDWWQVGGRWDDLVPGNQCKVRDLPPKPEGWNSRFFAVVTPDGAWHEEGKGGAFASVVDRNPDWPNVEARILESHQDCTVVVVDIHI